LAKVNRPVAEARPGALRRLLIGLPLALLSPLFITLAAISLAITDVVARFTTRAKLPADSQPRNQAASIVIPNWNGRDLLERYLPSVLAAADRVPGSEVIVVDNGSTDGSADFVRKWFPLVQIVALPENLGFGGGSNAGFGAAKHDVVVLLNSDMRVEPDFLQPLLDGFTDEQVFSVSCQIFFSDPDRLREETGLTEFWWERGSLRVRHRIDPAVDVIFPCAYGGGGSCAYDRRKFFELGGFDELLAPFYLEDTDLGYMAWKRGWKNLYQPASVVFHEHRGTIGRKFSESYIQGVLKKNFLLFTWKNIHEGKRLAAHLLYAWAGAIVSWLAGDMPGRPNLMGLARAVFQLPGAVASRSRARRLAAVTDTEALRRPLGGYFWDTFGKASSPNERLRVLFVSPYPICPPVHGGGVFMYQTMHELALLCDLHAIVLLDLASERPAHRELDHLCRSTEYMVRPIGLPRRLGSIEPHAAREFNLPDLAWLIHRQIYMRRIDVLQLEYTILGQYAGRFRRIPSILFEHDVYFQSIARRLPFMPTLEERMQARWEYLRSLRWELRMLPRLDRIQVCSRDNGDYLLSFLPELAGKIDDGFRAGIDTSRYTFHNGAREPFTLLFMGNFRHTPNQEALDWFLDRVFPAVQAEEPSARLLIVGAEPPSRESFRNRKGVELVGFVEDIREPLAQYAIFICPILSGSGVRVKLLEAFAAGIPVVSTRLGAEGLADTDGEICALADEPEEFARHVVDLLRDPEKAAALAARARHEVVTKKDMREMTRQLVDGYRAEIARKLATSP
jgi:GT2 family glycosyltransferase/glycosyltransferase involved in cell wall biosynthesis